MIIVMMEHYEDEYDEQTNQQLIQKTII